MTSSFGREVRVGIELEGIELHRRNGEITRDAYQPGHIARVQNVVGDLIEAGYESTRSQIELRTAGNGIKLAEVPEYTAAMAKGLSGHSHEHYLAPIASAALYPRTATKDGDNYLRGFLTTPNPIYEKAVAEIFPGRDFNATGKSGVHIHTSLGGAFTPDEAVHFAGLLTPFQHVFLAMSARSPFQNRARTGLASSRMWEWARARTALYMEFPETRAEYERSIDNRLDSMGILQGMTPDVRRGRVYMATRPTMYSVELRVIDTPMSAQELNMFAWLAGGVVAGLDHARGAATPPQMNGDLQRDLLGRASQWGLNTTDGMIFDPITRLNAPITTVLRNMVNLAKPALHESGVWDEFSDSMEQFIANLGRDAGKNDAQLTWSPLDREWRDYYDVHKRLQRLGDPGSTYDYRTFRDGKKPMSEREARTLQLFSAVRFDLPLLTTEGRAEAKERFEERIWPMIEQEVATTRNKTVDLPSLDRSSLPGA